MSLLKLAWKNIIANPLTLLLNIILFALGIGLINFLLLFNNQVKEKFESNLAGIDMVIGAKGSPLQMILCGMYHVDNPTGNIKIENAKPFLNPKHPLIKKAVPLSLGDNYRSFRIVGTTYDIMDLYEAEIQSGKKWVRDQEVTIGAIVARKTGLKLGDSFVSSHGFEEDEDLAHDHAALKVVGILKPTGSVIDQLLLTNTATIWNVHDHAAEELGQGEDKHDHDSHEGHDHAHHEHGDSHDHDGHDHESHEHGDDHGHHGHVHDNSVVDLLSHPEEEITNILVQFKNKKNFQSLSMARNINENTELMAASPAYQINNLNANIGVGTNALRYLAMLIAFVSGLSIFISLFKSLQERKYELALMRVSGASPVQLSMLILIEGLILAIIGFIIGIALSHLASSLMGSAMSDAYQYDFSSWKFGKNEGRLLLASLVIGIIAALIPAIKAYNTDINKTLSGK
jgi:putative ABC transport system permease protein